MLVDARSVTNWFIKDHTFIIQFNVERTEIYIFAVVHISVVQSKIQLKHAYSWTYIKSMCVRFDSVNTHKAF